MNEFPENSYPETINKIMGRWEGPDNEDYARFASTREIQPIRYLDNNSYPVGYLSALIGPPGVGKSTLACEIAAKASRGDKSKGILPMNVLILSTEDDFDNVLVPRLHAAGANLKHIIDGNKFKFNLITTGLRHFGSNDFENGLMRISKNFGEIGCVILDPISQVIHGDFNNGSKARANFEALAELAKRYDFAIIGLAHTVKNAKGKGPLDRISGPAAIGQVCRFIVLAAKNIDQADDGGTHTLLIVKNSNQKLEGGWSYSINELRFKYGIQEIVTSKIEWHADIQGSPEEILRSVEGRLESDISEVKKAENFLLDKLKDGAVVYKSELILLAQFSQISVASLTRAKLNLGIIPKKQGGVGQFSGWVWRMPN